MILPFGFSVLGLFLLVLGGDFVVKGASRFAKSFGVSQLVVGLTIVAFGTSAPELGVSILASLKGNSDIAITNVIGSNIFNTAFILGICALVSPLRVNLQLLKLDIPIFILASILAFVFSYNGNISKWEGMTLFLSVIIYTFWLIKASQSEGCEVNPVGGESQSYVSFKERVSNISLVIGGVVILVYGSRLLVQGASDIASKAGVSESVIGLTLVAAGTSLPELVSSLMATIKGETDIAIGNVIGSGIFNLLFILGSSALFNSNGLNVSSHVLKFDFPIMIFLAVSSFPLLVSGRKLVRWEGAILLMSYIGYTFFLYTRNLN